MNTTTVEAVQAKPATKFRWLVAAMIFIVYMIAGADRANIGVVIPYIKKEFGFSNTDVGAMASLFYLGYAAMQIPAGWFYEKFGVRKLFSFSLILTSIATYFMGMSNSAFAIKAGRVVLGVAEGPLPIGIIATINRWFPPQEKGLVTGIFYSSIKFAPAVVPPLCASIILAFGWREVFYFFAVPGFVFAAMWYWLVKDSPEESPHCSESEAEYINTRTSININPSTATGGAKQSHYWLDKIIRTRVIKPLDSNREIFLSWNFWGCSIGWFLIVGITYAIMTWVPTYLVTVKKYSIMKMGFVASAPWVGAVLGNIIGGRLSDKFFGQRRKPVLMITAASTIFMMYSLIYAPNNPVMLAALLFTAGILLNIGFSTYMVYPMGLISKAKLPFAVSVTNTMGSLGGAFAPFVVGVILDHYNWDMVFAFLSATSLITFVVLCTMIEPVAETEGNKA